MINLGLLTFEVQKNLDLELLLEYATNADDLGYTKFWLGEHYDTPNIWNNPEPLIPILLAYTENINVGAAGILLRLHPSYRIASNFKLMNAFFPGRVDLGLAGGHTVEIATEKLLGIEKSEAAKIDFNKKVHEVLSYYNEEEKHLEDFLHITPSLFPTPNVWLLGSRMRGFEYATEFGMNYSFSLMHNPKAVDIDGTELKELKEKFFELHGKYPKVNIAFAGVCAKTEKIAKKYQEESYLNNPFINPSILGNANLFEDKINEYNELFGVDEFIFLDVSAEMSHRIETIDLLAEKFKLGSSIKEIKEVKKLKAV